MQKFLAIGLAVTIMACVTGSASAMTKREATKACKAEVGNREAFLQRMKTGQSGGTAMRNCVRQKTGK